MKTQIQQDNEVRRGKKKQPQKNQEGMQLKIGFQK